MTILLQFGFCKGHSTVHALIDITERIRKCLDKGEFAGGVFVDTKGLWHCRSQNLTIMVSDDALMIGWDHIYLRGSNLSPFVTLGRLVMVSPRVPCWVLCCFLFISMIFIWQLNIQKHFILLISPPFLSFLVREYIQIKCQVPRYSHRSTSRLEVPYIWNFH